MITYIKKIVFIALGLLVFVPGVGHAAIGTVSFLPTSHTATNYTAKFQAQGDFTQAVKIFAWIGEYSQNFSGWNRNGFMLASIGPNTQMPANFELNINYASQGLVAGKVYAYVLADRTAVADAFFFTQPGTNILRCFTVTDGEVACPTGSGTGTGTQNPAGGTGTGTASGTNQNSVPGCPALGCPVTFNVTLVNAPNASANFEMKAFSGSGTVTNGEIDLYAGLSSTATALSLVDGVYSGLIPEVGVTFTGSMANLLPNTTYYFQLRENSTHSVSQVYGFTTNVFGNQAGQLPGQTPGSNPGAGTQAGAGTGAGFDYGNQGTGTGTLSPYLGPGGAPDVATTAADQNMDSVYLKNPFLKLNSFPEIFKAVYDNILIPIAVPFLAIAIMFAGYKFVVARKTGSADGYAEAKRILKYTLIGGLLLLGGWVAATALQGTLCEIAGTCTTTQTP